MRKDFCFIVDINLEKLNHVIVIESTCFYPLLGHDLVTE